MDKISDIDAEVVEYHKDIHIGLDIKIFEVQDEVHYLLEVSKDIFNKQSNKISEVSMEKPKIIIQKFLYSKKQRDITIPKRHTKTTMIGTNTKLIQKKAGKIIHYSPKVDYVAYSFVDKFSRNLKDKVIANDKSFLTNPNSKVEIIKIKVD